MRNKKFRNRFIFYILLFVLVTLVCTFVLWKAVPEYSVKKLPRISYLKDFAFVDQDGSIITQENVKNKIAVVAFFFTTCQGICPKMNNNMRKIYQHFITDSNIVILSHTVDPETDSPKQLKKYADSFGVENKIGQLHWYFLTGNKMDLYRQARESYTLDDAQNNVGAIEDQFIHTQFFALVDRKGSVRKVYDGLLESDLQELENDIREIEAGNIQE